MKCSSIVAILACLFLFACDAVDDLEISDNTAGISGEAGSGGEAGTAGEGGGEAGSAGEGGGEAGSAGAGGGEAGSAGSGGGTEPCKDSDEDGTCDDEDYHCNLDDQQLSCRRANPDCPRGTVPEVVNGCFNDICVSWDDCRAPGPEEVVCGGLLGAICPEDFYCQYPIEAMCGATDAQGVCVPFEPEGPCTRELFWVCGCDGISYQNECEAGRAGTSVASVGQCDDEPSICGTRGAGPCDEGEYCNHPIGANCGRTDMPGVCTPFDPTMACTREYAPVCGCDGVTYSNPCHAHTAGVSVDFEGPCEGEGNACTQGGNQCDRGEFCFFPVGASCGANGAQGVCEVIDEVQRCTSEFDPVCGCDGMTYSNACAARIQGVSIAQLGECTPQCEDDADCAPGGWCRADGAGGQACTPFQGEGETCGGFTLPEFYTRCAHDLFCYNDEPLLPDAPGICQPLCMSDDECGDGHTCNITSDSNPNGPCLSSCAPGEPCPDVCYGHCAPTGQQCGGFLGLQCPGGQTCNDDPNDNCDPNNGGADCPGICGEGNDECGPGACGPPPRLIQCENGQSPLVTCMMDESGMCGWDIDTSPCQQGPVDCGRGDCGDNGFCAAVPDGLPVCVPYAEDGDTCGGGLPPFAGNVCNPATHHCASPEQPLPGAPGICAAFCMGDNDCEGAQSTCIINPPCLSPEGNDLAVCYGYCAEPMTLPPREPRQ